MDDRVSASLQFLRSLKHSDAGVTIYQDTIDDVLGEIDRLSRKLELAEGAALTCTKCRAPHDGSQWSSCEHCSVVRTRFINNLEDLLGVRDRHLSCDEMLGVLRAALDAQPRDGLREEGT